MFFKRCYKPYSTLSCPLMPSPQTKELLKEASKQLEFYNQAGVIVTWVGNDWEIVPRLPTHKTANLLIPVGAASFLSIPNFVIPLALVLTIMVNSVIPKAPDDSNNEWYAVDKTCTKPNQFLLLN
ncbi:hypothetical protein B0H14DRAFT_2647766 [Mycena olivaceomarginata]|nr:hypothetical protein B0H14DRAFT_2647766 [Mycena olivaceomarginata]